MLENFNSNSKFLASKIHSIVLILLHKVTIYPTQEKKTFPIYCHKRLSEKNELRNVHLKT